MITGYIDVTKIDKTRLYKGEKGTYLNFKLIATPNAKYGDYMIVEATTKEEWESGRKGAILGNAKIISNTGGVKHEDTPNGNVEGTDNLPF